MQECKDVGYCYTITNSKTGKMYVGSTKNPEKRFQTHLKQLKDNKHHNMFLQKSFNKHGIENFTLEVIYEGENYRDVEQDFILDNYDNLYNISKHATCGDLLSYHPNREEIIVKITRSIKERVKDPEYRKKLSRPGKTNPNYRHDKCIINYCANCGERCGTYNRICRKCDLSNRSGTNKGFYGKTHSKETREKISKSQLGKENPNCHIKISIEGVEYKSLTEASKQLGIPLATVSHRVRSKNPKFARWFKV